MHGFIFLVDCTDRSTLNQATELLKLFKKRNNVPYLLGANKSDRRNGLSDEEIRKRLKLSQKHLIIPCIATDKNSVQAVVERLVMMIEAGA